jgi:hypothetical protein
VLGLRLDAGELLSSYLDPPDNRALAPLQQSAETGTQKGSCNITLITESIPIKFI